MKQFTPTPEQIRAAENVFVAMAHEGAIRPIVEGYETAILAKHQFHIAPKWVEMGTKDEVILDRKSSYLMSDEDSKVFHAECFAARAAAGLKVENPEYCPLLVAEHLRIDAENALLKEIAKTPGLESLGEAYMTMESRKRALDLTLKMLSHFVGDANNILERLAAA